MLSNEIFSSKQKVFLEYLAYKSIRGEMQLPPLIILSRELGMSVSSLREQMELARTIGIIEAHPRSGIQLIPYSFKPVVIKSLAYAILSNKSIFDDYSDLRKNLEKAYFPKAVRLLSKNIIIKMQELVRIAKMKLSNNPIQIPHPEHRQFHLLIYMSLNNDFVISLLEAYWMMYENVGLNLYSDLAYLIKVWDYHERIVNLIATDQFGQSYEYMIEHMELIKDLRSDNK
jgi:DNA-binding FadR family transcriptional regulator